MNARQNRNTEIDNISFDNMTKLKYFGMTPINKYYIHEGIKSSLNSGNA
jgi:hypothetical protein